MFVSVVLSLCSLAAFSQEDKKFIDISKTAKFIDTLLIDRDLNNWSVRVLGSFRQQRFHLLNGSNKYIYKPNNPYGMGLGIGTKKLTIDFTFNVKGSEEEPTDRFDLLGSFFKKKHMFDFYYQHYKGFNVENENTKETVFRSDIKSISSAIRYMYMFHESEHSIASMKTGLVTAHKTSFSIGFGGFLLFNNQQSSESIIPVEILSGAVDNQDVTEFKGTGGGILLGFSTLIVLPKDFFITLNVSPGIGLMEKKVKTETDNYKPENPVIHELGLMALIGYNAEEYYVNFSISNGFYATDFDFGNRVVFGYVNAKLAFGYKLKGKFKRNWKK